MNFFSGNSLWHLVAQADSISKAVLFTLLAMSVLCWAIFFAKLIVFRIKSRHYKKINKQLLSLNSLQDLINFTSTVHATAPGYFLFKNIAFIKELLKGNVHKEISEKDWILLEKNCENSIEAMIIHDESYLSILSSSAAVAPLLGLFGTVWGLIHAFVRISETQVADIATIAPGIAEALITTLAGLMVAIPALVMFNYLHTKARHLEHSLILLADRMMFIIQQQMQGPLV